VRWRVLDPGRCEAHRSTRHRHRHGRTTALHRGPGVTSFGARVALLIDPFGNTLGLNQAKR
jgi:hypothetical protein